MLEDATDKIGNTPDLFELTRKREPNLFSELFPSPKENDFTSMLAFVINPERTGGPKVAAAIISEIFANDSHGFDSRHYQVSKQRVTRAGINDLKITSGSNFSMFIEIKVELTFDDRSEESVKNYLDYLKLNRNESDYMILVTKYPPPDTVVFPSRVRTTRWHTIASAISRHLETINKDKKDEIARFFLEFLKENGMAVPKSITMEDGEVLGAFNSVVEKLEFILNAVTGSIDDRVYDKSSRANGLMGYDEPFYGQDILKKGKKYGKEIYYWIGFNFASTETNEERCLLFCCQLWIKTARFLHFIEDKYQTDVDQAKEELGTQAQFDNDYRWRIMSKIDPRKSIEIQTQDAVEFTKRALKSYETSLLPVLEKAYNEFFENK